MRRRVGWDGRIVDKEADNIREVGLGGGTSGADRDTVSYLTAAGGVNLNLNTGVVSNDGDGFTDVLANIEDAVGSAFADKMTGGTALGGSRLEGRGGADTLNGLSGSDTLEGGSSPWINPQAGVLSPLAMLARPFPIQQFLLVLLALKILLAFEGTWLLARAVGVIRSARRSRRD